MRDVCIIGIGQTPIGELWEKSLRDLGAQVIQEALAEAQIECPDALYVGNMLAPMLNMQSHLGALIADFAGLQGVEATTIEAACASGGAAFRAGYLAVASGAVDVVAVCGIEKMTDGLGNEVTAALAAAADAEYESAHGATFVALNALVMQRYMHEYQIPHQAFAPFSLNAHQNAVHNPNAMYQKAINLDTYLHAPVIATPINLYDSSPICDGAASAILCPMEMAKDLRHIKPIRVMASASATDSISLHGRRRITELIAGRKSAQKAYEQAGIQPNDIDIFEVHDAFSIMAALSLEAAGFAEVGKATFLAQDGEIAIHGRIPISTMGGLKARGHPIGATGMYEIVDLVTQLRGDAGKNQVPNATIGMTQNIGGTGATIVTHILTNAM